MKKILLTLAAVAMIFAGCESSLEDRVSKLENRVSELEAFVTNLNAEVEGIQRIVSDLQKNVYVTNYQPVTDESGNVTGYELTFNSGNSIVINHGATGAVGATGQPGLTPTIDLYEGEWYWRYSGGDWIKDSQDNMIPVTEEIEFSVKDGVLYITVNGEEKALGSVKGEKGDSMFEGVTVNEEEGTVIIDLKGTDNNLVLPFNAAAAEEEFELNLNLPASTEVVLGGTIEFSYTLVGCAAADAAVFVQAPED
jgi:outer membrane murein-binding lipoprotein Lpp